jgi:hypothetical protein
MAMERSKQSVAVRSPKCRKAQSSLVRRLLQASDDPAKQRIRRWLSDINDQQLLIFGLTADDIAVLRDTPGALGAHKTPTRLFQNRSAERRRA